VQKGYVLLENGQIFEGKTFGASKEASGELVFTTNMTGYLETLTDPSYYGQMVVQTFPMIGNCGVIPEDFESRGLRLSAYIVREWCLAPSNFRCQGTLDDLLKNADVPGLYDLDTRALTKVIRQRGVMNAMLLHERPSNIEALVQSMKTWASPRVDDVTCAAVEIESPEDFKFRVVLMDFGAKGSIGKNLAERGCEVITVPSFTTAEDILVYKPDGLMLSNGPGDPADNTGIIKEMQKLCEKRIPIFGICLGHQLLALAQGGQTEKLKYGHRGGNQPVKDLQTGHMYMSSQNHGYAVSVNHLPKGSSSMRFENGNDFTCEGIDYLDIPAFSVQFHPEAACGPLDTRFLFDRFIKLMGGKNIAAES
jgi:carbamoyl-phosphate synthase small subunit